MVRQDGCATTGVMATINLPRWSDRARLRPALASFGGEVARRTRLALDHPPAQAKPPPLGLLAGELAALVEPVARRVRPPLRLERPERPRVVILLPGFATHPVRMRYMALALERIGHTVKRWGGGFNLGPTPANFELMSRRVQDVSARYGQNVVLVGWSLGGLFAREMAKRHPAIIDKVITMGSPFSDTPWSNNVWRFYQFVTGYPVDSPPIEAVLREKPPVETVALWSPRDGVVSPRSACGRPGERDRAVALRCTHLGFAYSPESIRAVARELA